MELSRAAQGMRGFARLAVVLLTGCDFERPPPGEPAEPAASPPATATAEPPLKRTPILLPDSSDAAAVREEAPVPATPPPSALPAELAALRAEMVVPVQGVPRSALRDSYAEARGARVHEALDIMAPRGTPVLSAAAGRVLRLHPSAAGGNMVYAADVSDRFILMYSHLDRYAEGLAPGAPLRRGQLVGYVGISGNANPASPHLHFAIARGEPSRAWWLGTPVNPYPLLAP
jgi:peptidoglycan LD-endopeptidase LytH